MATGFAKPAGIYRLTAENWMEVMGRRPAVALWGVGHRTALRLGKLGIRTVADLAAADLHQMAGAFGPTIGPWLIMLGRGVGDTDVVTEPRGPRGRSRVTTLRTDLTERADIDANVAAIAREVADEVLGAGRIVRRVAVTVRTATFFTRTKITTLPTPTTDAADIVEAALTVLDRFPLDRPVRLLGVRVEFVND